MKLPNTWDKFDINEYQSKNLNEAPMDRGFAKDFEKDCKVLITHVKHEITI